jgi:2,3-bisphosphoglycerate-independent phosphoglycerate mutase
MDILQLISSLKTDKGGKIVLVVADGLGGLPMQAGGKTELGTAATPNLDALVKANTCGAMIPVLPGITPGSGPGHLGLFGYDPLKYVIGRGVLEALGIDFDLRPEDVAARGNFCTVDATGAITDRRAGRIATEASTKLVEILATIKLPGVEVFVKPVKEHRFVLVLRAKGLEADIDDTDPGAVGAKPLPAKAKNPASQRTAELLNQFIAQAAEKLQSHSPANMLTLRGIARRPAIPTMKEAYGLNATAIAVYPMYRGLARLVGMKVENVGQTIEDQIEYLRKNWANADFFFVHYKYTDSTGEDGNFAEKIKKIEALDQQIAKIVELKPDVLIVTADHSTPAKMKSHSWHPVPVVLAADNVRPDNIEKFDEVLCINGGLGQFESKYLMSLAMAHAGRLQKYGA